MAFIFGHLTLKLRPLRIPLLVPKPGGALMVLRRHLVTASSLPMVCCVVAHTNPV